MIILIIIGLIIAVAGVIGCIIPVIPGPALNYIALLIVAYAKDWEPFSMMFLIVTAILTIVVTIFDYIIPAIGAQKFGASKFGVTGSLVGMVVGIFFGPLGMILGAFIGALAGELITGSDSKDAIKAGWGVFMGNIIGTCVKLAFSLVLLFCYIKAIF